VITYPGENGLTRGGRTSGARRLTARGLGTGVRAVLGLDELTFRAPSLWSFGPPELADCWIAYAEKERPQIAASIIVVIEKTTGRVVYCGSANDEG
jgi:hypothetical protein